MRTLLLLNVKSGTGLPASVSDMEAALRRGGPGAVETVRVDTHAAVRSAVAAACVPGDDVAIVVGGGGGSLRAAVEGGRDAAGARFVPLRLGSGNVASRALRWPKDPLRALELAGRAIASGRTLSWPLLRVTTPDASHACVSLGGFGAMARLPGDVERGPRSRPRLRRVLARLLGLERLNAVEHVVAALKRGLAAGRRPERCDLVRVEHADWSGEMRLLAGILRRHEVAGMPWRAGLEPGDAGATLHLLPSRGATRALRALAVPSPPPELVTLRIRPGAPARLTLLDPAASTFHLDEDAESFTGTLMLAIDGHAAFVGPPEGGP